MKCYKIKVGIEEYPVKETDIERIVSAMKTNDMVKLDCGIFRGQSILAVCQDFAEEQRQINMSIPKESGYTPNQELIRDEKLKQQKADCVMCGHTGWIFVEKNGEKVARYCVCTILKDEKNQNELSTTTH